MSAVAVAPARYSGDVVSFDAAPWLPDAFEPLISRLGNDLTVRRDGSTVHWGYDGLWAVVELRADGRLEAMFVERPSVDRVTATLAAPVYRRPGFGYALSPESCAHMATDLADFFSGTREPRFTFVGACPVPN